MMPDIPDQKRLSDSFFYFLCWLIGGLIAYLFSYVGITFLNSHGENTFFGPDSFYHARRILTTAEDLTAFYQYDDRSSSWISWPWAYDWILALVIKIIYFFSPSVNGASILVHIPPLIVFFNAFLIIGVAKAIDLKLVYALILMLCFALSPLTKLLHVPGRIDHHMIEYSFVLASLWAGIGWFKNKNGAIVLGIILGIATAFHNGLFVLQLPLVLSSMLMWLSKVKLPKHTALLCISLILSNFLVSLPSEKFLEYEFTFYFQSWFHTYICLCTAIALICLNNINFSLRGFLFLTVAAGILAFPITGQLIFGLGFLSADLPNLPAIDEMHSPYSDLRLSISEYSYLLLVFPIPLILLSVLEFKNREPYMVYLLVFLVFGSILLLLQRRLQYFGSIALYLPTLILLNRYMTDSAGNYFFKTAIAFCTMMLMYVPCLNALTMNRPLGSSYDYAIQATTLDILKRLCEDNPGLVLADYNDGHFITYHTKCSVIANNMMISPEDFAHIKVVERYLNMTVSQFSALSTDIDYLYIRRSDNIFLHAAISDIKNYNAGLRSDLLIDEISIPGHWRLVAELVDRDLSYENIVKIYDIRQQ